jgi:uncharacterized membrane protein YfcA
MAAGWIEVATLGAALVAVGAFAGLAAGLLGTGGGALVAPALFYCLQSVGQTSEGLFQIALGTSLGALAAMSARALRAQAARGAVDWGLLRRWGPAASLGALVGAGLCASAAPGAAMAAYGVAALLAGLTPAFVDRRTRLPARLRTGPAGAALAVGLGVVSGGGGLGGGALGAPLLRLWGGVDPRAMAAGFGVAIAAPAAVIFVIIPAGGVAPPFTLGAVNLVGVVAITLVAGICAPFGARMARHAPARIVTFGYGFFLVVTGLSMLRAALSG